MSHTLSYAILTAYTLISADEAGELYRRVDRGSRNLVSRCYGFGIGKIDGIFDRLRGLDLQTENLAKKRVGMQTAELRYTRSLCDGRPVYIFYSLQVAYINTGAL